MEECDYSEVNEIKFCESCLEGKQHRIHFLLTLRVSLRNCYSWSIVMYVGRLTQSVEYLLAFIDDKTRYVWVYVIRHMRCLTGFVSGNH